VEVRERKLGGISKDVGGLSLAPLPLQPRAVSRRNPVIPSPQTSGGGGGGGDKLVSRVFTNNKNKMIEFQMRTKDMRELGFWRLWILGEDEKLNGEETLPHLWDSGGPCLH